jgi:hypothetical protein
MAQSKFPLDVIAAARNYIDKIVTDSQIGGNPQYFLNKYTVIIS